MSQYECNATITFRKDFNDELFIIRVSPDEGQVPEFEPGQYAELAIPEPPAEGESTEGRKKLVRRSYSIASSPAERDHLEFYIVKVEDGFLTPKLWSMKEGDRIWLGPKIKGKFTLDPVPPEKDLVMIATGTGLAPFLSMLKYYHGAKRWRRYVVLHGARYEQDLGYRDELMEWAEKHEDVFYIPSTTREPEGSEWNGIRGRVQTILDSDLYEKAVGYPLAPEECQVFLCGNPAMIDTVQELLESKGFKIHKKKDPGNIHVERYW